MKWSESVLFTYTFLIVEELLIFQGLVKEKIVLSCLSGRGFPVSYQQLGRLWMALVSSSAM